MNLNVFLPTYTKHEPINFKYTFSVFTSIYNRADTLERVFKSLNAQTFKDFELVLINDGSKDNSHNIALELIETATFPVNYINNSQNKHKMACYKQAIDLAQGEFLLPLDSDDECVPEALEVFKNEYDSIPDKIKPRISGVTCLCNDQYGNLVGQMFPKSPFYSNTFKEQLYRPKSYEKWGFAKTIILKGIQINPDIFSKGLIPEGIIWNLIAKEGFDTKYVNSVLRIYYLDTPNSLSIKNNEKDAFGMAIYSLSVLNWHYQPYLFKGPKLFAKRIYTLLRASRYLEFSLKDYKLAIQSNILKFCFLMGWPFKRFLK